jgi:hypothetical protein
LPKDNLSTSARYGSCSCTWAYIDLKFGKTVKRSAIKGLRSLLRTASSMLGSSSCIPALPTASWITARSCRGKLATYRNGEQSDFPVLDVQDAHLSCELGIVQHCPKKYLERRKGVDIAVVGSLEVESRAGCGAPLTVDEAEVALNNKISSFAAKQKPEPLQPVLRLLSLKLESVRHNKAIATT